MYQLATAPRGIGQALDSIFQLARTGFVRMLPYAILTTLISALPFVYMLYSGALENPALAAQAVFSGGYWLTVLVVLPVTTLLYGASIVRIESIAQDADVGIGSSFRTTLPRSPRADRRDVGFPAGHRRRFRAPLIPGIYLLGSLFLFVPAIVLEGKGPMESLNHSHKLVKGNWWRLATIGGIAIIMMYLVYLVAALVVGFDHGIPWLRPGVRLHRGHGVDAHRRPSDVSVLFGALRRDVPRSEDAQARRRSGREHRVGGNRTLKRVAPRLSSLSPSRRRPRSRHPSRIPSLRPSTAALPTRHTRKTSSRATPAIRTTRKPTRIPRGRRRGTGRRASPNSARKFTPASPRAGSAPYLLPDWADWLPPKSPRALSRPADGRTVRERPSPRHRRGSRNRQGDRGLPGGAEAHAVAALQVSGAR